MSLRRLRNWAIGLLAAWFVYALMYIVVALFSPVPFVVIVLLALSSVVIVANPITTHLNLRDVSQENDRKAHDKYD